MVLVTLTVTQKIQSSFHNIHVVKMFIPSKAIYSSNEISIEIPTSVFTEMEKKILKFIFIWNHKNPE